MTESSDCPMTEITQKHMPSGIVKSLNVLDSAEQMLCKVVSVGTLLMVLLTVIVVILRYAFGIGSIALQETIMYLHAMVFMLGIPYTWQSDGHVRVDVFYRRCSPRQKTLINFVGNLIFLIPLCIFILLYSWSYTSESWRLLEGSKEAGGLPLLYLLKSLTPLMATLVLWRALIDVTRACVVMWQKRGDC